MLLRLRNLIIHTFAFLIAIETFSETDMTASESKDIFSQDNLGAWCIVPYDTVERGPAERVGMLGKLGFTQYAWDWRDRHLQDLKPELEIAKANGIQIRAVWIWIDANTDSVGTLNAANEIVLNTIADAGVSPELWVGFHENFYQGLDHDACVKKGAEMISYLTERAEKTNSSIALYNHGGWFGESESQIAIIEAVASPRVGMIYNFHHAHHEINRFPENLQNMLPHLMGVSINGMNPGGPKIMRIGTGEKEADMLKTLKESGYAGPVYLLCHDEEADAEVALQQNLDGLRKIVESAGF